MWDHIVGTNYSQLLNGLSQEVIVLRHLLASDWSVTVLMCANKDLLESVCLFACACFVSCQAINGIVSAPKLFIRPG